MGLRVVLPIVFALVASVGAGQAQSLTRRGPARAPHNTNYILAPLSFTQSTDPSTITPGNSAICGNGTNHQANSFLRRFDLNGDHGATVDTIVTTVDVAVEFAASGGGTGQPLTLNLYSIPNAAPLLFANMTLVGSAANPAVADQSLTMLNFPVAGTVDSINNDLVVELQAPSGVTAGHVFIPGSNAAGQLAPTYLLSSDCGITVPTETAGVGFPDMHLVMTVNSSQLPVETQSFSIE